MTSGILFDLDGTLVDSRRDLAAAVNAMRRERGLSALPLPEIVRHIGWGARNLVARCLAPGGSPPSGPEPDLDPPSAEDVDGALAIFLERYDRCLLDTTVPYPGIRELLAEGMDRRVPMAVVTNKPERLSRKILAGLGLADPFATVVGGDTTPEKKPSARPLLHALAALDRRPDQAVVVGDSETDLKAARAAGCAVILVSWGFTAEEELRGLTPDRRADTVLDLQKALWVGGEGTGS